MASSVNNSFYDYSLQHLQSLSVQNKPTTDETAHDASLIHASLGKEAQTKISPQNLIAICELVQKVKELSSPHISRKHAQATFARFDLTQPIHHSVSVKPGKEGQKRVFVSLKQKLKDAEGGQGFKCLHAIKIVFDPSGRVQVRKKKAAKEVVILGTDFEKPTPPTNCTPDSPEYRQYLENLENFRCKERRLSAINKVNSCSHFPKTYAMLTYMGENKRQKLRIVQEKADCNLLTFANEARVEPRRADSLEMWSPKERIRACRQLLEALVKLRKKGIAHRDLKPENVLVFKKKKRVKITDFGFACATEDIAEMHRTVGSLAWSAPEVIRQSFRLEDKTGLNHSIDIWSMGLILHVLAVGSIMQVQEHLFAIENLEEDARAANRAIILCPQSSLTDKEKHELKVCLGLIFSREIKSSEVKNSQEQDLAREIQEIMRTLKIPPNFVLQLQAKRDQIAREISTKLLEWSVEMKNLVPSPRTFRDIMHIAQALLQDDPSMRMDPKEALKQLEALEARYP